MKYFKIFLALCLMIFMSCSGDSSEIQDSVQTNTQPNPAPSNNWLIDPNFIIDSNFVSPKSIILFLIPLIELGPKFVNSFKHEKSISNSLQLKKAFSPIDVNFPQILKSNVFKAIQPSKALFPIILS